MKGGGGYPPSGPQIRAASGMGYLTLATVLPPPASPRPPRPTPNQRGEVLCRLSSAGYCLPPTAQLPITERGPISTSEPSQITGRLEGGSHRPEPEGKTPGSTADRPNRPPARGLGNLLGLNRFQRYLEPAIGPATERTYPHRRGTGTVRTVT